MYSYNRKSAAKGFTGEREAVLMAKHFRKQPVSQGRTKPQNVMKEKADAPAQISQTDLDRPNPDTPGDTSISSSATQQALQANDAEKMTPDEANELSTDDDK